MIGIFRSMLCLAALLNCAASADAACTVSSIRLQGSPALNVGTYTVATTPGASTMTLTFLETVTSTDGISTCKSSIALWRSAAPTQMYQVIGGTIGLPYDVTNGAASIVNFGAGTPTKFVSLPNLTPPKGTSNLSVTTTITFVPGIPQGLPSAGSYGDGLTVRTYDGSTGTRIAREANGGVSFAATVLSGCATINAGPKAMDFTSDISNGLPTGAFQNLSFLVSCNALAKLRIDGSALVQTPTPAPAPGFDTLINYNASASTAGALTTFTTTGTVPVSATSATRITAAAANIPVTVVVGLVRGRPLKTGVYKSVLRVTIDPAL